MKDELNKKIRELCNSAGSSAACAMAPVLTEDLDRKYDERVAAGMSELDAYRDVLRSVDRIEAMLRALPKDSPKAQDPKSQDQKSQDPKTAPKKKTAGTREAPPYVRPSTPEEEEAADLAAGRKRLSFLVGQSSALLWVGTTLLYFLWSLTFGGWRYTWIPGGAGSDFRCGLRLADGSRHA